MQRRALATYGLITGGLLAALIPLLLHTSGEPVVLGRYSPRVAALLFALILFVLTVGIAPFIAPRRIDRWLTDGIARLASTRFGLEFFIGALLLFWIALTVVLVFAWSVVPRTVAIIGGAASVITGIVWLTIDRAGSKERVSQMAKHLALILFGLVLGVLATEAGLNLLYPRYKIYAMHPPSLRFVTEPDLEVLPGIYGTSVYTTQPTGMRGDPYDANRYNILAVGGSSTEDGPLDDSETWTHLLQEQLDQTAAGQQVWVGAAAHADHGSAHHTYVLRYLVPQYRVDTVLILLGVNDLAYYLWWSPDAIIHNPDDPTNHDLLMRQTFSSTPDDQPYQSHIVNISRMFLAQLIPDPNTWKPRERTYHPWIYNRRQALHAEQTFVPMPDLQSGLDQYERNLKILIREARSQNLRLVLMTQPVVWRENLPAETDDLLWMFYLGAGNGRFDPADLRMAMDAFNARLLEVCEAENVECIDLAASMSGNVDYFYDDMHFTEAGAAEVASLIAAYLEQHPPFTP